MLFPMADEPVAPSPTPQTAPPVPSMDAPETPAPASEPTSTAPLSIPEATESPQETPLSSATATPSPVGEGATAPPEPEIEVSEIAPVPSTPATPSEPPVTTVATTPVSFPQTASAALLPATELPARGLAARRARTQENLDTVLILAGKQEYITNDDVEKHLHVSNATASRYLSMLVKVGKLLRIGSKSHARYKLSR